MVEFITFFKKRYELIAAISVVIMLLIICFQLYQGNNLREEISENCGWGGEDYRCYCEKFEALAIKAKMDENLSFLEGEVENVQVDR